MMSISVTVSVMVLDGGCGADVGQRSGRMVSVAPGVAIRLVRVVVVRIVVGQVAGLGGRGCPCQGGAGWSWSWGW